MAHRLEAIEVRVLGALIEKARTTPDYYPMRLSNLTSACNQKSNRDPVTSYDSDQIERALDKLAGKNLVFRTYASDVKGVRYRHGVETELRLDPGQEAVLCVLLLRGPQTVGELRSRTDRMQGFGSLAEVEEVLDELIEFELVTRLPRQPGRKDCRYMHLLGGPLETSAAESSPALPAAGPPPIAGGTPAGAGELEARVSTLEEEVARLRRALGALEARFDLDKRSAPREE